jgi:hypothetical protein
MLAAAERENSLIRQQSRGVYGAQDLECVGIAAGHRLAPRLSHDCKSVRIRPVTSAPGRIRTCAHGSGGVALYGSDQGKPGLQGAAWARMGRNPQAGAGAGEVAVNVEAISWALNLAPALLARAASRPARASSGLPGWPARLGRVGRCGSVGGRWRSAMSIAARTRAGTYPGAAGPHGTGTRLATGRTRSWRSRRSAGRPQSRTAPHMPGSGIHGRNTRRCPADRFALSCATARRVVRSDPA